MVSLWLERVVINVRIDAVLGHGLERNPLALAVPTARLAHVVLNVRDVDNLCKSRDGETQTQMIKPILPQYNVT